MASQGFFIICDISGYTAFLTKAELDHAEEILNHLLNALVRATVPPLRVVKLEGDAIFSFSPEKEMVKGQTLLEIVESIYGVFRQTQERSRFNTTCSCTACTLIPSLDLKFVVHHGDYMEQSIAGIRDLQGAEVITVHRLLKNAVREKTGVEAYAFFSQAAVDAAEMAEMADGMVKHAEEYEHVGRVNGYVHDLHTVWERMRAQRHDRIEGKDVVMEASVDLPVPLSVAWDYISRPEHKLRWMKQYGFTASGKRQGRQGVGSYQHCHHSATSVSNFEITDWRPLDYYTYRHPLFSGMNQGEMFQVAATEGGARYTWRGSKLKPTNSGLIPRLTAAFADRVMVLMFGSAIKGNLKRIRVVIEEDIAAGKIAAADQFEPDAAAQHLTGGGELSLTPIPESLQSAHEHPTGR